MCPQPTGGFVAVVPELEVTDLAKSLAFWCDLCGFTIAYDRPETKFAFIERAAERAQFMLCTSRGKWNTGALEYPLGRGINFEIGVDDLTPIYNALKAANWPLFQDIKEEWRRVSDIESGCREFLVQDPDGYLLRFSQHLSVRKIQNA